MRRGHNRITEGRRRGAIVKIRITVTLDERCRRAIALYYGQEGLATREDCITNLESLITSHLGSLAYEMDTEEAESAEEDP